MSLGDEVKKPLFVKAVLSFIVPSLSDKSIQVLVDNERVINLAAKPFAPHRLKHIDVRFHFIRGLVMTASSTSQQRSNVQASKQRRL